jgi:hypothetical protein
MRLNTANLSFQQRAYAAARFWSIVVQRDSAMKADEYLEEKENKKSKT